MGAWGIGLFQDDVAIDVRNEFLDLLSDGASDGVALATMVRCWKDDIADIDDGPVFWLALAGVQWEYGRLHPTAKSQALKVIDNGKDLHRWAGSRYEKKRQAILLRLKKKLLSPAPPKRTPRPRVVTVSRCFSVKAPDQKAVADAFALPSQPGSCRSQVVVIMKVKRTEGGGSVFVASCEFSEIKLKWLNADTLQITYPKTANVEQKHTKSFYYGRTIAVKYRRS
ncbi:MAG: hypothetical protein ACKVT0_04465 [Planctomycetaceae bacterium]